MDCLLEKQAFRRRTLGEFGALGSEVEELLAYNHNVFDCSGLAGMQIPLEPELHTYAWEEYRQQAERVGVFEALRPRLVQFAFPVQAGISETAAYRQVTRRGTPTAVAGASGLTLERPEALQLRMHRCSGGTLPVLVAGCRADFVALVRALVRRNEPEPVSESMGACLVQGLNNWDRIAKLRTEWESGLPTREPDWPAYFRTLAPRKELYQDRLVVLSTGPYSNVPAQAMGLGEAEWQVASLTIRLEHECTHYFTYRALGSARNNLFDELLCDYMGIAAAAGRYRADWFVRFLGLEDFPTVRPQGRVHLYRGRPPLTERAFQVELELTIRAAYQLEALDRQYAPRAERTFALMAASCLSLEELASDDAPSRFEAAWKRVNPP